MLRSIKQLYGKKLGASDGDIGHLKDFYFSDQQWVVRYVIADTGSWLSGRLVLGRGPHNGDDPHLRSTQALRGYHTQTNEEAIGRVTDLMIDDKSWAIRHLVVETGHWFSGKEIVISPEHIDRISYEESKVFVNVTKEAILEAPEYHVPPLDAAYHDTRNFDE